MDGLERINCSWRYKNPILASILFNLQWHYTVLIGFFHPGRFQHNLHPMPFMLCGGRAERIASICINKLGTTEMMTST